MRIRRKDTTVEGGGLAAGTTGDSLDDTTTGAGPTGGGSWVASKPTLSVLYQTGNREPLRTVAGA